MLQTFKDVAPGRLTTFGLGTRVPELIELSNLADIPALISNYSVDKFRTIGRGSNLVLPDNPLSVPLVRFSGDLSLFGGVGEDFYAEIERSAEILSLLSPVEPGRGVSESQLVFAFAGTPLITLSRETSLVGLSGLEFAAGIPGSIGGAVKMNAGAHGSEIGGVLTAVLLFSEKQGIHLKRKEQLNIAYREGGLPDNNLVLGAVFKLERRDEAETKEKRRSCLDYRKRTQPLTMPSSGSVFRNPSQPVNENVVSAGWLIEQVGLKGERVGGVAFSELHANWLVRIDDEARAADAAELVELAKLRVAERFGVALHEEIIFW